MAARERKRGAERSPSPEGSKRSKLSSGGGVDASADGKRPAGSEPRSPSAMVGS